MKTKVFGMIASILMLVGVLFTLATPAVADEPLLPIVYVHGGAGSAAQYEGQAQRWASNGYPNLVAGLDRFSSTIQPVFEQMDDFFDAVMAETGANQIYAIGHSAGTGYMKDYLNSSPERSARIAKFIGLDSQSAGVNPLCPGNPDPVPCIGIYRDDNPANMGPNTIRLPMHGHTQCVTSVESFVEQYKFLTGKEPKTTLILPEPPGQVDISGRAINYPANTAAVGSTLQIWEINGDTGARIAAVPKTTINIGPSGEFGPINVNGKKNYEFTLIRPEVDFVTHYYFQPFIRDNHLIRLLVTPSDSAILAHTPRGPDHTSLVILRYYEWWSDQAQGNDTLWVATMSPTWANDSNYPPPLNILSNPAVAPKASWRLGIHTHDSSMDKVSTLAPVPWFLTQAFQTGVDIWMPATEAPDGTITFMNEPRGNTTRLQTINIPNWASANHRVLVQFNSYFQDINSWDECKKAKPSPCK
jgi:pimeloyl-ACP methyl ester carboxylesterase